jgi:twitching motility protein PilJ
MSEIAEITQQTAEGTKDTAVSINSLARMADELRVSVSAFKLPSDGMHAMA